MRVVSVSLAMIMLVSNGSWEFVIDLRCLLPNVSLRYLHVLEEVISEIC